MLPWLWCSPAAAAPIGLLTHELPYATGVGLKKKKKKRKKERKENYAMKGQHTSELGENSELRKKEV